jgi:hypothetical protein
MSQALDRILAEVRQLSPDERRQLRERLDREAHIAPSPAQRDVQAERAALITSVRGKYAYVPTSSEAFNQRKQEEIELEDRRR